VTVIHLRYRGLMANRGAQHPDLLDRMLPDSGEMDIESRRRGRLILATSLASTIWAPIFAVFYFLLGQPEPAIVALIAAVAACFIPVALRITRSASVAGHVLLAIAVGAFTGIAVVTGGFDAPVTPWFVLVPMVSMMMFGRMEVVGWGVVTVFMIVGLWLAPLEGIGTPLNPRGAAILELAAMLALVTLMASVSLIFDWTRDEANQREIELRAEVQDALMRAETADRQKARMVADLAHEVRLPLRSTVGLTDLLLETELDAVQTKYAQTVRGSAVEIGNAMAELAELAQVASGNLTFQEVAFDLRALVEDVAPIEAATAQAKGVELVVTFDPHCPRHVISDPARLKQALTLMVANAVGRTETGEVVLRVSGSNITRKGGDFTFELTDTRKVADSAHGVFHEIGTDRSASGFGMAVARQLVEILGGEIETRFSEEMGSWMAFTLGLATDHDEHTSSMIQPHIMGRRVLVVDANAAARSVLIRDLDAWQMRGEEATGAEQAIALVAAARDDPYLLAFVDNPLRTQDGDPLAHALAELDASMKIVVLVPFGKEAAENGDPGVRVSKPVRISKLPGMLARAVGGDKKQGA